MEKRRAIKFRMWRDGKMQNVFQLNAYQDHRFDAPLETEEVLMQFTGLHDKNGKEIYEGDVVEYKDYSGGARISFSGEDVQPRSRREVKIENMIKGVRLEGSGVIKGEELEVIGNVFENQNLLTTPAQSGK